MPMVQLVVLAVESRPCQCQCACVGPGYQSPGLMSRAERAGRAKKMNNSHCPALRRRRRCEAAPSGEAASWLHWKGRVWSIASARFSLYPASRVSGRGPAGLGKPKPLLDHAASLLAKDVTRLERQLGALPSIWNLALL